MVVNGKNLCKNCFEETESHQNTCHFCGYTEGKETLNAVLPAGTILLGRFVIGRVLGKGGFGVTYLSYDLRKETKVAIKEYMPDSLAYRTPGTTIISTYHGEKEESFKAGAEKFYEEAKTVSKFNGHPNIVNVYEFFYENNTAYFVMEYIEGVDLKTYVAEKGGRISQEECIRLLTPIMDSLIIVHSIGILHRDISPDNIYICKEENVKLLDFGAARQVLGEKSKSLSVILKPGFAPFEQYQTHGKQGPWTDVYALAATMYYCVSSQVPDAAMDRIEADNLKPLTGLNPGVSEELQNVLKKALAVKITDRYQSIIEFKQAIGSTSPVISNNSGDLSANVINSNSKKPDQVINIESRSKIKVVKERLSKTSRKKLIAIASGFIGLLLIAAVIIFAVSGRDSVVTSAEAKYINCFPMYYLKDYKLYSVNEKLEKVRISGSILRTDKNQSRYISSEYFRSNSTRNIVYFLEDIDLDTHEGDLYVKEAGNEKVKIAERVESFKITLDGKAVLFLTDYDKDKEYGELYLKKIDGEKVKISSDVNHYNYYFYNDDTEIVMLKDYDTENDTGDLYVAGLDGNKKLISNEVHEMFNSGYNEKQLAFFKNYRYDKEKYFSLSDLYIKEQEKEPELIVKDTHYNWVNDDKFFFTIGNFDRGQEKGDLYCYEYNNDAKKIDEGVSFLAAAREDEKITKILYIKNADEQKTVGDLFILDVNSGRTKKVVENIDYNSWKYDENTDCVWYLKDYNNTELSGTMYVIKVSDSYLMEEKVADKVFDFTIAKSGVIYTKDLDKVNAQCDMYFIPSNKRTSQLMRKSIAVKKYEYDTLDDSFYSAYRIDEKGLNFLFFENITANESGDMYLNPIKEDGNRELISRNIYMFNYNMNRDFSQIFFLKDFDKDKEVGDFYIKIGNKEPEKVDSEVTRILFYN